jgi:hypothetical protein
MRVRAAFAPGVRSVAPTMREHHPINPRAHRHGRHRSYKRSRGSVYFLSRRPSMRECRLGCLAMVRRTRKPAYFGGLTVGILSRRARKAGRSRSGSHCGSSRSHAVETALGIASRCSSTATAFPPSPARARIRAC